ncbi:unnamed protein product [Rhizophagus irregularis]|nr:unnamed protein product [Rhizophagus irregularis]
MSTFHSDNYSDNFNNLTIASPPDALTYRHRVKGTRALFGSDDNQVLILRSNGKFLMWSLRLTRKNLLKRNGDKQIANGFQLFKMDYWKTVKRSKKTINASKLGKINAEIIEAWNNSDKVREIYIYQTAKKYMSPASVSTSGLDDTLAPAATSGLDDIPAPVSTSGLDDTLVPAATSGLDDNLVPTAISDWNDTPEFPEELQLGKMKEKYQELGVRRKNLIYVHEKIPPAVDVKIFSHSKL